MSRRTIDRPLLTERALNRATLARQGLLERQAITPIEMLTHLIGMQGQMPKGPHVGLWSRLHAYRPADLERLLLDRTVVRATLMRCTLHVATAADFLGIRPLIDGIAWRGFRANHLKPMGDADIEAVREESRALLDAQPLTVQALGAALRARWPLLDPIALSMPARFLEPLVHVPPAGFWGSGKPPALSPARRWLGRDPGTPIDIDALALRYLAAFGPATGADFSVWLGVVGGAAVFKRLRPRLISFVGEDGRELFDLPDAPRPSAETPAPVRLLGDYDNILIGYDNRQRLVSSKALRGLVRANGMRPAFTVDGMVQGSWKLTIGQRSAQLAFAPFEPLGEPDAAELQAEGEALIHAMMPGLAADIRFDAT